MKKFKGRMIQIWSLIKFMIAYIPAIVCRLFIKNSWIVCEDKFEARDNGYWLYKYIRENHPKRKVHFALSKKSPDYDKVKQLGNVVNYDSVAHWFWYIVAKCNISSQASGRPENAVAKLLEKMKFIRTKFCFLQHGVIINDLKWLYNCRNRIDWFLTSAKPEYDFIVEKFGYDKNQVKLLGLPRFDNLHDDIVNKQEILFMPTWRTWIKNPDGAIMNSAGILKEEVFEESDYFKKINEFINHPKLAEILNKHDKFLTFYPHRNMQRFLSNFDNKIDRVKFCSRKDEDIQVLLKRCSTIITDYSSVFMDIIYMQKPVLFYQFDETKFRAGQYDVGYFDYHNNPYSLWADDINTMLDNLEKLLSEKVKLDYEIKQIFPMHDTKNCERIYKCLTNEFD